MTLSLDFPDIPDVEAEKLPVPGDAVFPHKEDYERKPMEQQCYNDTQFIRELLDLGLKNFKLLDAQKGKHLDEQDVETLFRQAYNKLPKDKKSHDPYVAYYNALDIIDPIDTSKKSPKHWVAPERKIWDEVYHRNNPLLLAASLAFGKKVFLAYNNVIPGNQDLCIAMGGAKLRLESKHLQRIAKRPRDFIQWLTMGNREKGYRGREGLRPVTLSKMKDPKFYLVQHLKEMRDGLIIARVHDAVQQVMGKKCIGTRKEILRFFDDQENKRNLMTLANVQWGIDKPEIISALTVLTIDGPVLLSSKLIGFSNKDASNRKEVSFDAVALFRRHLLEDPLLLSETSRNSVLGQTRIKLIKAYRILMDKKKNPILNNFDGGAVL